MILSAIFVILLLSIILLLFIPNSFLTIIRLIGILGSGISFLLSVLLLSAFNKNDYYFQNCITLDFNFLNLNLSLGLDGLSIFFLF